MAGANTAHPLWFRLPHPRLQLAPAGEALGDLGLVAGELSDLAFRMKALMFARMMHTVEAVIDEHGGIRLLEAVQLPTARRALVTILDDAPGRLPDEPALLAEAALADWNRTEEDAAWQHLQQAR